MPDIKVLILGGGCTKCRTLEERVRAVAAAHRLPVEVEYASELRYRNPPIDEGTLLFAITQSGETADTLAALREMKRKGHPTLAICNVVGSTIANEADGGVYLQGRYEINILDAPWTEPPSISSTLGALVGLGDANAASLADLSTVNCPTAALIIAWTVSIVELRGHMSDTNCAL